ncbi:ATPase [Alphaproteobacteria bacterium KMM 3653]|uniref:ATPase n=1 Tax=Harenicola maris TaxID=2841044 RepID=A0AAP2CJW0_9RHOB|nr:ATPase [Harenicola maris]
MSDWKAKRFWKEATVEAIDGGMTVHLDGRPVRTPAKAPLVLPTEAMARAIATEWDAQEGEIKPETMPVTRGANAALDKVALQFDEVAALIIEYGQTDLLCYRAAHPEVLIDLQAKAWDPLLDWASERYGARLAVTTGMMPVPQDPRAVIGLEEAVKNCTEFTLTALSDLVGLSGSLVIGLAAMDDPTRAEALWLASRVDEDFQISQWGEDEEASETAARKRADFMAAVRFFQLSAQNA